MPFIPFHSRVDASRFRINLLTLVAVCGALLVEVTPAQQASARAPERYRVRLQTTKGDIVIEVHRDWAPHGADRFHELVRAGYYDDVAISG